MSLPTQWILCTKWVKEVPKPLVLTEEDKKAEKAPTHKLEYDYIKLWTPIGSPQYYTTTGKVSGIPFSYKTQAEAVAALKEIITLKGDTVSGLKFSALEVRYVPNKIKQYKQDWYDKYVKQDVVLQVEENKTISVFKEK